MMARLLCWIYPIPMPAKSTSRVITSWIAIGRYFHATDADGIREVLAEIDRLERSEVSEIRYLEYEYHYLPFVTAALAATALSLLLSGSWLRRLPA